MYVPHSWLFFIYFQVSNISSFKDREIAKRLSLLKGWKKNHVISWDHSLKCHEISAKNRQYFTYRRGLTRYFTPIINRQIFHRSFDNIADNLVFIDIFPDFSRNFPIYRLVNTWSSPSAHWSMHSRSSPFTIFAYRCSQGESNPNQNVWVET